MKALIRAVITLFIASLCQAATAAGPQLEKVWESDGLNTPESVAYDQANGVLYVSNINGAPGDKDGNGFISKFSLDGNMIERQWVTGLDAPKGIDIAGNKLYVSDIDTLVEINIDGAAIVNRYQAGGAGFFNDVVTADDGTVYVSDTATNTIHRLRDGNFEAWLQDEKLDGPNGLQVAGDRLMVASLGPFNGPDKSQLFAVSLSDQSIRSATGGKAIGKLDGLEGDGHGNYFATDWPNGGLLYITRSGAAEQLLDLDQGSADLEYIRDRKLIIIPMMLKNKIVAYKVH